MGATGAVATGTFLPTGTNKPQAAVGATLAAVLGVGALPHRRPNCSRLFALGDRQICGFRVIMKLVCLETAERLKVAALTLLFAPICPFGRRVC